MEQHTKNQSRVYTGLFLVGVGLVLLAEKMGAPIPGWVISWPTGMIALGVILGLRHNFRNPGGLILIAIGGLNLADRLSPGLNLNDYIFPLVIMVLGLVFILRPHRGSCSRRDKWNRRFGTEPFGTEPTVSMSDDDNEKKNNLSDFINSTSVFGAVKKIILSKNFKGGDITCFMGGAELNLSQADIQKTATIDVTQIFGGTKLIVPANWNVKMEVMTIFGGVEDKRPFQGNTINPDKLLVIKGTSLFGGIDIKSY